VTPEFASRSLKYAYTAERRRGRGGNRSKESPEFKE